LYSDLHHERRELSVGTVLGMLDETWQAMNPRRGAAQCKNGGAAAQRTPKHGACLGLNRKPASVGLHPG